MPWLSQPGSKKFVESQKSASLGLYAQGQSGQFWNIVSEQKVFLTRLGGTVEISSLIEGLASMNETSGSIRR